jgi:SAM-dependent methyltransferase
MVHRAPPKELNYWVENKTGFELGGPSMNTFGPLGVYDVAAKVDVTNFAADTLWEKGLKDGSPFLWKNQSKGTQYIRDAVDLHDISDELYDFVAASHVLEHIANPFKALLEWLRILKPGGALLVITPLKTATFDHKRDVALIEHLIDDYHNQTTEADLSHLDEIVRLHDFDRDPPARHGEFLRERSQKNFENRGLHQHVYDQELLYYIFKCLNLDVKIQITCGNNDIIIGQKKITFVD